MNIQMEKMHWARYSDRAWSYMPLPGVPPSQHLHKFCNTKPILLGILWQFHHVAMINYKLHFQPLNPLWRAEINFPSF